MQNNRFKIGDRVKYTSRYWGDQNNNPFWGGVYGKIEGTVTHFNIIGLPISIFWNNTTINSYNYSDLELIERKQEQLNLFGE